MRPVCEMCDKTFSSAFNLDRHMQRKHDLETDGSEPENASDDEAEEDQVQESDDEQEEEENDDGASPLDLLVERARKKTKAENDGGDTKVITVELLRRAFRQEYRDTLLWIEELRRDPIHQSVMVTARKLRDELEMDRTESIESAIAQRKFLLNRIIPSDTEDTEDSEGSEMA